LSENRTLCSLAGGEKMQAEKKTSKGGEAQCCRSKRRANGKELREKMEGAWEGKQLIKGVSGETSQDDYVPSQVAKKKKTMGSSQCKRTGS